MSRAALAALLAASLSLGALVSACSKQDAGTATCPPSESSATPIDTDVMAFLSAARARHHEANVKEDGGDLAGAIGAIEQLVEMKAPHPGTPVVEIEEVLADAYARLAELRIKKNDLDGAARDATKGLSHATQPTYFRGHLMELSGIVEEERAKALDAAGKPEEAKQARARAIALFHDVVSIQSQVIERSLADGGAKK